MKINNSFTFIEMRKFLRSKLKNVRNDVILFSILAISSSLTLSLVRLSLNVFIVELTI